MNKPHTSQELATQEPDRCEPDCQGSGSECAALDTLAAWVFAQQGATGEWPLASAVFEEAKRLGLRPKRPEK